MVGPQPGFLQLFNFGCDVSHAQDITGLESQVKVDGWYGISDQRKVDPSNPSDSIVVADDWSGLR